MGCVMKDQPVKKPKKGVQEKIDAILDLISKTGIGLAQACKAMHCGTDTIYLWMNRCPENLERYVRAREDQAEYLADQIIEIADTCEDANKARLQIDARKWTAAKLRPKRYGDNLKHDVEVAGDITITIGKDTD
jgi:hypothetical protein